MCIRDSIITQNLSKQYIEKSNIVANLAKSKITDNYVFPSNKLPRNRLDIDRMALENPDRQGFIDATAKEIQSIVSMGTWNPDEKLADNIEKN